MSSNSADTGVGGGVRTGVGAGAGADSHLLPPPPPLHDQHSSHHNSHLYSSPSMPVDTSKLTEPDWVKSVTELAAPSSSSPSPSLSLSNPATAAERQSSSSSSSSSPPPVTVAVTPLGDVEVPTPTLASSLAPISVTGPGLAPATSTSPATTAATTPRIPPATLSSSISPSDSASPAFLKVESIAARSASSHDGSNAASASASPSAVSGSSTPARSGGLPLNELQRYHKIQQQLLSQHIHQQLQGPVSSVAAAPAMVSSAAAPTAASASASATLARPSSSFAASSHQRQSIRASPPSMSNQPSASHSAFTSPPDSGRSSPDHSGSARSGSRPQVLETHKLDIQTHTSGRRMVNQYLIESELGRGVHGKVRLARDLETGERVAVKIVEREARKRLGAGLGLLGRSNQQRESKSRSRFASKQSADVHDTATFSQPPTSHGHDRDDPSEATVTEDGNGTETAKAAMPVSHPSTHFAPLPAVPRSPSSSTTSAAAGRYGRWGEAGPSRPTYADKEAERQREKEKEKARKALLWTTDQKVRREIAIMKKCCHANVVSLKEVIDDPQSKKIFMVLEYMEGGEIVWKDEQGRPTLTVDEARSVVRDIVCGLEYLHYQGIIHRDIKPANLLWDKDRRVKISDFGVSHFSYAMMVANDQSAADNPETSNSSLADDRELAKTAGSPAFFAPELCMSTDAASSSSSGSIHRLAMTSAASEHERVSAPTTPSPLSNKKHKVTKAIDIWALGVTLYCLLFGNTPFTAESEYALFAVIPSTDYNIPTFMGSDMVRVGPRKPRWRSQCQWTDEEADAQPQDPSELSPDIPVEQLSEDARQLRDLLDRLLEKDPTKRITLEDVKKHPWVTRGLQDAPAWLSETDPHQHPFVEISHADVEDALTGFSKLKQRVKRWQAKLLESFGGGRHRSRSINTNPGSSAASSIIADHKSNSGGSSPMHSRAGHHYDDSAPSTPADTVSGSAMSSAARTPRTPLRAPSFFTRQKSASSVGRKEGGGSAFRALSGREDADSVKSQSQSPRLGILDFSSIHSRSRPPSPPAADESGKQPQQHHHQHRSNQHTSPLVPSLPSPAIDLGLMHPPSTATQRRPSIRSNSSDTGLRPPVGPGPAIPERRSSDTHMQAQAQRQVSAQGPSPTRSTAEESLRALNRAARASGAGSSAVAAPHAPPAPREAAVSPQMSTHTHASSGDGRGSLDGGAGGSSVRRSMDSVGRSSMASISQASRVSGRHRLGDFLRGTWLINGDNRHRSLSRPSTRGSREATVPGALSGASAYSHSSHQSHGSGNRDATGDQPLGLSIDTEGAIRQVGARPDAGTPTSAPLLTGSGSGGGGRRGMGEDGPRMSADLLADPLDGPSRISFAAASQPSSPPGPQTFAFDSLGRRQHTIVPSHSVNLEHDDVDLDLDLSDDDLDDDAPPASGAMLVNSGQGWMMRQDDPYLPEAYGRKNSDASSNDILTPSVEGGYNVYKPPYRHILPRPTGDHFVDGDVADVHETMSASFVAGAGGETTFAMEASLSGQAEALRRAELTELQTLNEGDQDTRTDSSSGPSSAVVSRSPSHKVHSNESSSTTSNFGPGNHAPESKTGVIYQPPQASDAHADQDGRSGIQSRPTTSEDPQSAQFDDADEETTTKTAQSNPAHPTHIDAHANFDDEDSDENCISFQARRKKSSRMLPVTKSASASAAAAASAPPAPQS
ncbi:kinase-like protein [Testicularia cyperi]|uniref:Kinase-like protein n=1 Tax=Testicularia cyperi TaxID=1882483 RepID=A0A317XV10_9BASI|nr:kinase-like protein [Testicularia cyperi]